MKKIINSIFTVIMFLIVLLTIFAEYLTGTFKIVAHADDYESIWMPVHTLDVTTLSFEQGPGGANHKNSYHFDSSGQHEQYAFCPFTGRIVFTTSNYGLVLYQSINPVRYVDGSIDYCTVAFMHLSNASDLDQYRIEGRIFKQGTDLFKVGGIGAGGVTQYAAHFDIGVYKGSYSWPTGYYSTIGNMYPFNAFFINPSLTKVYNPGKIYYQNWLTHGSYTNWEGLWKNLDDSKSTKPDKPNVSVEASDSAHNVNVSWAATDNTTNYDIRFYNADTNEMIWCIGQCDDSIRFYGESVHYTDTSYSKKFPTGSYKVSLASVNDQSGEFTYSDDVYFQVTEAPITQVTVTFVTATGNTSTYVKKQFNYNQCYGDLPTPEKEIGRIFIGWTKDGTIVNADSIVNEAKDHNLYAKYEYESYLVSFDPQGGTSSVANKRVEYLSKYNDLPVPERAGYTFNGWKKHNYYITEESLLTEAYDVTLYADWIPNKYKIIFNGNEGICKQYSQEVIYSEKYGQLPEAWRDGYVFVGWTKADGSLITENTTVDILKDTTLYAKYVRKGDVDCDNEITSADIQTLQQYLLCKKKFSENQWKIADLNEDGNVNIFDHILLKRMVINRILPTNVSLERTQKTLNILGNSSRFTLKANIIPSDATDKSLTWSSSNPNVVTVSDTGELTALTPGESTITATTINGKYAVCDVTVVEEIEFIWSDWSEWGTEPISESTDIEIETKEEPTQIATSCNMEGYTTREVTTKHRQVRPYSVAGHYDELGLSAVYGEHHYSWTYSVNEVNAAQKIFPGEQQGGPQNQTNVSDQVAYSLCYGGEMYQFFIISTNYETKNITYYRSRTVLEKKPVEFP